MQMQIVSIPFLNALLNIYHLLHQLKNCIQIYNLKLEF